MNQGKRANKNGATFRRMVTDALELQGYIENAHDGPRYRIEVPAYISIYGSIIRADVFVQNEKLFTAGLVIECKYQGVSGSADEKYPYVVASLKRFEGQSLMVVDGDGYRQAALDWAKTQVDGKLIGVFNLTEFMTYVRGNL